MPHSIHANSTVSLLSMYTARTHKDPKQSYFVEMYIIEREEKKPALFPWEQWSYFYSEWKENNIYDYSKEKKSQKSQAN